MIFSSIIVFILTLNCPPDSSQSDLGRLTLDTTSSQWKQDSVDATQKEKLVDFVTDSTNQSNTNGKTLRNLLDWLAIIATITGISLLVIIKPLIKQIKFWYNITYSTYLRTIQERFSKFQDFQELMLMDEPEQNSAEPKQAKSISQVLSAGRAFQVLGKPGSGKTTCLSGLMYNYAKQESAKRRPRLPVYLEFRGDDLLSQMLHFLHTNYLSKDISYLSEVWLKNELSKGRFIILIDDVHKIFGRTDDKTTSRIQDLLEYKRNTFVLMSRDYFTRNELGIDIYSVSPLTDDQIEKILRMYTNKLNSILILQELRWNKYLRSLYDSPQMLSFLAKAFENYSRIPQNKATMFSEILKIQMEQEAIKGSIVPSQLQLQLLRQLSVAMLHRQPPFWIEHQECLNTFTATLNRLSAEQGYSSFDAPSLINEFLKSGFLIRDDTGLRFRHDQWQEYFAALEIFEKRISLKSITSIHSFTEVMYFVSGLHNLHGTEAEKEYCHDFVKQLSEIDFFLLGRCVPKLMGNEEHMTLDIAYKLYEKVAVSRDDIKKKYGEFLSYYQHFIDFHFPNLKNRFEPRTTQDAGVFVEKADSKWSYWHAFVEVPRGQNDKVTLVDRTETIHKLAAKDENEVLNHYMQKFPTAKFKARELDPVVYQLPIIGAYEEIQDQLEELIKRKTLAEPMDLQRERLFYEGRAFAKKYGWSVEGGLKVKDVTNGLRRMRIRQKIGRNFIHGTSVDVRALNQEVERMFHAGFDPERMHNSTTYGGIYRRSIVDVEFETLFAGFVASSGFRDSDIILPPLEDLPKKYIFDSHEEFSELDRQRMIEWCMMYFSKFFTNYKELLEINFPTSKNAFETYIRFPILIALVVDKERFKANGWLGERFLFANVTSQTKNVEVKVVRKEEFEVFHKEVQKFGWVHYPNWKIPRNASPEPLREGIYERVLKEYKEASKP